MTATSRVLIIDDDERLNTLLTEYLGKFGYSVRAATRPSAGLRTLKSDPPDLVILDVMLPEMDGLAVCRKIRESSKVPVIMLTARGEVSDRIVGLELGADDYMPKPFNPRELLARIKSVLRRHRAVPDNLQPERAGALRFAGWTLDLAARNLVSPLQVVVALSGAEFRLLRVFLSYPNRVLSRDQLMDLTVGREADPFDRSVDVQVSRLRQRLGDDAREPVIIKTVRGEGYVLAAGVEPL
jgi:two-component system OmpR family response regulator